MAASPSSLARRMKDCRVEMMPSASVVLRIKSTATSLPASPAIRSTCTTAKRPASWMRRTMEEILQISPYNTNTTRIFSLVSALRSPASSLTAAMTGVSRMASISSCFMLFLLPGVLWGNFTGALPASAAPYRCRLPCRSTGCCRQSAPWGGAGRRCSPPWRCRQLRTYSRWVPRG